jgi:hypothetical protein
MDIGDVVDHSSSRVGHSLCSFWGIVEGSRDRFRTCFSL